MDLLYTDLNFNSVENLPGFEAHAAFTVNSASVSCEDVDIVPNVVDEIVSLTFRGVVTIKCRSTCSRSRRWQQIIKDSQRCEKTLKKRLDCR